MTVVKLKQYIVDNQNTADVSIANSAVAEFLSNYKDWKEVVGYVFGNEDGERLYGSVLCVFSSSLYLSNQLSNATVQLLKDELNEYDKKVKYYYGIKYALYANLVLCLKKLSLASNEELKEHLKKSIYYSQAEVNHTSYKVECYAYRKVSNYLLDSFRKEEVNMSPPTTFNDPFDCPILELFSLYGDDISKLAAEAYKECIKITCFVKNNKVEPDFDKDGNHIWIPKHNNDPEEYLNELMWAHYADNHMGVCIKYHFNNDITKFANEDKGQIAYFRDIEYTSDMDVYRRNGAINLQDAFFVKGKAWEYENELRLLAYDPYGTENYTNIDAKNSIVAVYFGLKCPTEKKAEIIKILKDHKWLDEKSFWDANRRTTITKKEEHPVEFFQMEVDETHFGKLKAVKI